ncbi:MAG: choice-of-anchor J domain-containing protein [Bacteroidales bacterium]|nr:choice-of-anchor J domain-containing protein [Bacteroidales bacterium]
MKKLALIIAGSFLLLFSSCVKQNFEKPPIGTLPEGAVYTIAQLRQMYVDSGAYTIKTDASVYGVITMDETSGNIYKSAYMQDASGAVNLRLLQSGGLRVGDSIRVFLKGIYLSDYGGMFQLDSIQNDSNIVILATQQYKEPKASTLANLLAGNDIGELVKLEEVQFAKTALGSTWSESNATTNRTLEDCYGNSLDVRTSNYASFAGSLLPEGNGSLIAIAGIFNGAPQLYVRSLADVDMTGDRCSGVMVQAVDSVHENFGSAQNYTNIAITGWTNYIVAGTRAWQGKVFNTDGYAQATGYNSGLSDMETWLISPPVKNQNGDMKLSFKAAQAYWKHTGTNQPLTVLASTNFDGSNFDQATWTELTPTLPTSSDANYDWVQSGVISLADFTGNVSIAFKYKGSDTESTTSTLDDVVISPNATTGGGTGGGTSDTGVTSLNVDFSDQTDNTAIAMTGWLNVATSGTRTWLGKSFSGNIYAQATAYNSTDANNVMWLITPKINLDGMTNPQLSFETATAYWTNDNLEVLISTDFDGTNISNATWTPLNCTLAGQNDANYTFVNSGTIDLSSYTGNAYIAFKYSGNDGNGETSTYQVDNIVLQSAK